MFEPSQPPITTTGEAAAAGAVAEAKAEVVAEAVEEVEATTKAEINKILRNRYRPINARGA